MGNSDDVKPATPEKSYSAATEDQNNTHHMYHPDWAPMQAYYGPQFPLPPYMNSTVPSSHAPPPYMWAPPQTMMPPYGAPYAAFYAHGGVYVHPGVPLASTTLSMETPAKSPKNTDRGFVKKLKEFDGLAMSIGNGNSESADNGTERRIRDSDETGGSSDGSNGIAPQTGQRGKKRRKQGSSDKGDGKVHGNGISSEVLVEEIGGDSVKTVDVSTPAASVPGKPIENTNTTLELKNVNFSPTNVPAQSMSTEVWLQSERELKRERRKQSNRESARRSRLRKQAETEELAVKVRALTAENMALKSEIDKLMENSEQMKFQNTALMVRLQGTKLGPAKDMDQRLKPVGTVNLLARVNNSDSGSAEDGADPHGNQSPRAKLHQLLADAVAAS